MRHKRIRWVKSIVAASLFVCFTQSGFSNSTQSSHVNPATGATTWGVETDGVYFSLTQLLPDQLRAFYANRGFSLTQIEPYASSCVYMTVLRNDDAPGIIHYMSNDWPVLFNNKHHALVSVNQWIVRLTARGATNSSLIAFRWAQFPPEQEYRPGGDWNQGMLSIGLPAGSQFDISATWKIGELEYEATLAEVRCAE